MHIRTQQVSPQGAIAFVEQLWGRDLSGYDPDGPLPDVDPDVEGGLNITRGRVRHDKDPLAVANKWRAIAEAKQLSMRQLVIEMTARASFVGSPTHRGDEDQRRGAGRRSRRLHPRAPPHAPRHRSLRRRRRADPAGTGRVPSRLRRTDPPRSPRAPDLCNTALMQPRADSAPLEVALIGAGPTAASLFERIAANLPELLPDRALRIHLVDPHRAGTGRVWRPDQHPLLWMNSMAEDVTLFVDDSVACEGPAVDGPVALRMGEIARRRHAAGARHPRAVRRDPGPVGDVVPDSSCAVRVPRVVPPQRRCAAPAEGRGRGARVSCGRPVRRRRRPPVRSCSTAPTADPLQVDVVAMSLGHLDALPDDVGTELAAFASDHDLGFVPCGHTAEQDLSALTPGADVLVVGLGQAFTDLVALVTEGRGRSLRRGIRRRARATSRAGLEPCCTSARGRGVPYRSKLPYRLLAPLAPAPPLPRRRHDRRAAREPRTTRLLRGRAARRRQGDRLGLLPRAVRRASRAHDDELGRVRRALHDETRWGTELDARPRRDRARPRRHFDIASLDQPLAGVAFASSDALHRYVADHVAADVARRTNTAYSADLAAFTAMLGMAEATAPRSRPRVDPTVAASRASARGG